MILDILQNDTLYTITGSISAAQLYNRKTPRFSLLARPPPLRTLSMAMLRA